MTDSLYRGTGGHNYIQEEDMETSFIKQQQEEARKETKEHCQKAYEGILSQEVIDATVSYWNKRTDTLTAQIIKNMGEEIKKQLHETARTKCYESVEDIINNITKV